MFTNLHRTAVLTMLLAAAPATAALSQATAPDPHHPEQATTETAPPAGAEATAVEVQGMQPGQPGQMGSGMMSGMMGHGMMGQGMMGANDQPGMMGGNDRRGMMESERRMHGHMIRIVIAITDADADGAISLEESTEVHRRIFRALDADKDGRVTAEEMRDFMAM